MKITNYLKSVRHAVDREFFVEEFYSYGVKRIFVEMVVDESRHNARFANTSVT